MQITCIIPVYDQAEFLPDAIESVLAQTKKCEIIVINDGSTDKSFEIAKSYEDKGVKVINQVNKGLPSARNTGIMNATGEYILPLDADDVLLERAIEVIEDAITVNGSDVIAPSFKSFGVHNEQVILNAIPTLEEFKQANRIGYFSAVKKSILLEIGGYNPKMKWGFEDWDMWIDIFKRNHSLCLIQEVLVLYRTKQHSMLTVSNQHAGELNDIMKMNHPEVWQK